MKKELVVAVYDRNSDWTTLLNADVQITKYNKNVDTLTDGEILLEPNVGRDVHTFFYHIVKNYNTLADYTFFSQDYPFDHVENYIEIINSNPAIWDINAKQCINHCWFFNTATDIIKTNKNGEPHHPGLDITSIWDELFDMKFPYEIYFTPAGHFCIAKETILLRPKRFYKKILKILETDTASPWIIERLEPYIFNNTYWIIEL